MKKRCKGSERENEDMDNNRTSYHYLDSDFTVLLENIDYIHNTKKGHNSKSDNISIIKKLKLNKTLFKLFKEIKLEPAACLGVEWSNRGQTYSQYRYAGIV